MAEDAQVAEQAHDYINHILHKDNDGYLTINSAFKDALVRKVGIVKYWWDEVDKTSTHSFTAVDNEGLDLLQMEDGAELVEREMYPDPNVQPQMDPASGQPMPAAMLNDVTIRRSRKEGRVRLMAVPPEEFLIDRRARSLKDASIVAHRSYKTVSELVAMGYDQEEVEEYAGGEEDFGSNI